MGNNVNIHIEDHSGEVLKALQEATKRALTNIGIAAVGYAQDGTPVDTGLARNSIAYALDGEGATPSSYTDDDGKQRGEYSGAAPDEPNTVFIGSNVVYFPVIENGSTSRPAWHPLKNAAANHSDEYRQLAEKEYRNA